jgi:hypothetical protein
VNQEAGIPCGLKDQIGLNYGSCSLPQMGRSLDLSSDSETR